MLPARVSAAIRQVPVVLVTPHQAIQVVWGRLASRRPMLETSSCPARLVEAAAPEESVVKVVMVAVHLLSSQKPPSCFAPVASSTRPEGTGRREAEEEEAEVS